MPFAWQDSNIVSPYMTTGIPEHNILTETLWVAGPHTMMSSFRTKILISVVEKNAGI